MLDVISRPLGDEGVQCPDVVDDHLVPGISKFLADLIIDDVLQPPLMHQTLAQCQSVPGRQPLAFKTPECHRLDSPLAQPQPSAEVGQLEAPEFDPPLFVLVESVLQGGDAASAAGCVVDAQISHHGLDWWVLWSKKFAQLTVDAFVCDDERRFVAVDHQPCFGQVVPELLPGVKCSLRRGVGHWYDCRQIRYHQPSRSGVDLGMFAERSAGWAGGMFWPVVEPGGIQRQLL